MFPMIRSSLPVISLSSHTALGNMEPWAVLLLALLAEGFAENESCMNRCENGFDSLKPCQCDSMCKYYKSCCSDYEVFCGRTTRGDTFALAEDDDDYEEGVEGPTASAPRSAPSGSRDGHRSIPDLAHGPEHQTESELELTKPVKQITRILDTVPPTKRGPTTAEPMTTRAPVETTTVPITTAATEAPDPDAEVCSGRPFDSFTQLKNGSIYAFRGKYFFELDQKSVSPGYPKLIEDVWGISGPIDAAFTRVNCQGKTYIFKGNKYWRFDNGVLDGEYPRDISVGFDGIPDDVDAAFALPAAGHRGKEKVYFFKGEQYYTYEFLHQPTHEECVSMSERSPSTLFRRYTDVYYSNYEPVFRDLFSDLPQHQDRHHYIDKDWRGIRPPVDAVMAGRIYISPWRSSRRRNDYQPDQQWNQQQNQQQNQQWDQQWNQQQNQQWNQQWGRRRQSRSPFWGSAAEQGMNVGQELAKRGMDMGLRLAERRMEMEERLRRDWDRRRDQDWDQDRRRDRYRQNSRGNEDSYWDLPQRSLPIQSVYFFKGDKYYRVDLRTKRVDQAMPPYPRSIAKYWLGCSNSTGAEK
ncbi:vitronectin a isoform X2 [Betta splendens]|uniref:Vitronectin a isoform X2 n=1 Tax=Betta splendens TaxID=158456 RepID=A0A9W2Y8C7_BETSP|nr:vitronectin a isoform X2 [Betta splendens]